MKLKLLSTEKDKEKEMEKTSNFQFCNRMQFKIYASRLRFMPSFKI